MAERFPERPFTAGSWVSRWDLVLLPLVIGLFFLLAWAGSHTPAGHYVGPRPELSLNPALLPIYALKTTLRMLVALAVSFVFTIVVGTWAAKSPRAERVLIPLLDIGQSVPILGFLSFAVLWVVKIVPDPILGADFAAVFAIFTSQVWNMAFSYYQSLKMMPKDLRQAADVLNLSRWQRFKRLEFPHAVPLLVWNTMMSVSGGWFFVVASEAISVAHHQVLLPGVGSYISVAIAHRNMAAIGWAILAMFVVIMLYDQLAFRPMIAWAEKFKMRPTDGPEPQSWMLDLLRRSRVIAAVGFLLRQSLARAGVAGRRVARRGWSRERSRVVRLSPRIGETGWNLILGVAAVATVVLLTRYILAGVGFAEVGHVFLIGFYTLIRVLVLTLLASLVWVPVGIALGLNPRMRQRAQAVVLFLSAFPANLLFPIAVVAILRWHLNPEIWLSPLMMLGAQWYIIFNVIAGAQQIPGELREAADNLGLRGWPRWRRLYLPAILPYYATGGVTAAGAAWNATIVAEFVTWGGHTLTASGVGAYIAEQTASGNQPKLVLGIAVMIIYVLLMNRLLWARLYRVAEERLVED